MYLSTLDVVLANGRLPADELFEKLRTVSGDTFSPIWDTYNPDDAKLVLLYITYCYSKDSESKILGVSNAELKQRIAAYVGLPDRLYGDCVGLLHQSVRDTVAKYLDFQHDRVWKLLQMKQDQYDWIQGRIYDLMGRSSASAVDDEEEEFEDDEDDDEKENRSSRKGSSRKREKDENSDLKLIMEFSKQAGIVTSEIEALEKKYADERDFVKRNKEELAKIVEDKKTNFSSGAIEHSDLLNRRL